MNYVDQYVNFYSGENKKLIYRMVDTFCGCVRTGELDPVREMLTKDCIADISMLRGGITGQEEILAALRFPREDMDIKKLNIFNYVCRVHEKLGQIYFYTQSIVSKDDGENVFPFAFGGQFCITVVKENNSWKMKRIKYDLMYDYGNTCFVRGKWKLMNYGQYYGHTPIIFHEIDSPWNAVPEDDEPGSELEQYVQEHFRSSYAMDAGSVRELYELTPEPKKNAPSLGARKSITRGGGTQDTGTGSSDKIAGINFQREKIHKEARLQHVMMLGDMKVIGEKRYVVNLRSEYNRLYNHVYNRQNIHSIITTVVHPSIDVWEDGKWEKLTSGFDGRVVFEPVDDDCIRYDDYICGGRKWINEDGSVIS